MKKYLAIMVAFLFLFGVVGMSFAQATTPEVPKKAATEPSPAKKGQEMTPEKKAKTESSAPVAEGQAKPDKTKVKKSDKQKKRQADTDAKKKAKDDAAEKGASGK
jgi:outer membrane biosynthesis protein TonB